MKKVLTFLAVLSLSTYAYAQNNTLYTYLSTNCDSVELHVPIGATRGTVQYLLSKVSLTKAKDPDKNTESYTTATSNLMFVISYTPDNKVMSVFMYVQYDRQIDALKAKAAVNAQLEQNFGDVESSTKYFFQNCSDARYARRATVTELGAGSYYLTICIVKVK